MLPAVSKVVLEDVLLEWEEEVISRGGEKKKGRKKGKVKKKGREGGTEGRKKKKNRKEKKKRGELTPQPITREALLPWHLKLPTPRGPFLDLAGQACWWDPTLDPGRPLPPGQGWLHNPSVEAVQEASHMG